MKKSLRPQEPESDRIMKDVVAPPVWPLTTAELFGDTGIPDLAVLKEHLLKEGRLEPDCALQILRRGTALLKDEPNILELKYPITVCGDVHGQFFDLIRLFEVGGHPSDTQYLFLGDYVDRGCFSTECVFYLWAMKINFPTSFYLLRGNHECRQLTAFFNFKDECAYKYDLELYDTVMESFDVLPLAATVNKNFFCVHGGLSPDIAALSQISALDRQCETPREGPMCDLLWSDPYEEEGEADDSESSSWFGYNETRQCSYVFGMEAVKQFLLDNKLTSVIRAHEAQVDGYKMQMVNAQSGIPRVITIFSAPNYCDVYKNKAACLKFDNNVLNIKQFLDSPHPYYLPNFMDVFQWSLPFVAEKVTDLLANVLDYEESDEDEEPAEPPPPTVLEKKGGLFRKKVLAVTKVLRLYRALRQNNEAIVQLKQLTPSHKIPFGLLSQGPEEIQRVLSGFDTARQADLVNEKMPGGKHRKSSVDGKVVANIRPRNSTLNANQGDAIAKALMAEAEAEGAAVPEGTPQAEAPSDPPAGTSDAEKETDAV